MLLVDFGQRQRRRKSTRKAVIKE